MAESELVLRRLLNVPSRIHSIFLSPRRFEMLRGELAHVPPSIPIYVADIRLMSEITGFHIHRGVLAAGRRLSPAQLMPAAVLPGAIEQAPDPQVILVAEGITNVDNM
ncbi:MAG TPA: hypothetical protein VG711_11065, partial [Phycisphaerales bacterium]|nr:hypothetical protein [Phycisphaerales bacterium]